VQEFVRAALSDRELVAEVATFVACIAKGAYITSLARTLLKLTAPGVPDIYQGTELWDFSVVDPDNRRAVDYARRRALLARIKNLRPEAVMSELESGAPKLWLIWKTLQLRSQQPELFDEPYKPLVASGPHSEHVLAYGRGDRLITAVPRLNANLDPSQRDAAVTLPDGRYQNVLTDELVVGSTITAAQLWTRFPVALLVRQP
jgi:(1->4)-alpha-D-glucan 1-alpha-D-glucosylmutase